MSYDSKTGVFTWLVNKNGYGGAAKVGRTANNVNAYGYRRIGIDGERYLAHRIAWLYVYGEFPKAHLDHINRDRLDNRIANLRVATDAENLQNQAVRTDNTSGVKGVSWDKKRKKWFAKITHKYKQIALGCYESIEDAAAAYATAKAKFHTFNPASI